MANDTPSRAGAGQQASASARATFEIVVGHPSAEEVAAVTVALRARLAAGPRPAPPIRQRSAWTDRSRLLRLPIAPGPDAWRRSALPR